MNEEKTMAVNGPKINPSYAGIMKRTARDCVFSSMFNGETAESRRYLLEMDKALYGEQGVTEEDIVTRKQRPVCVLCAVNNATYSVGDRLVIVEEVMPTCDCHQDESCYAIDDSENSCESDDDSSPSNDYSNMKVDLWIIHSGTDNLGYNVPIRWTLGPDDFGSIAASVSVISEKSSSGIVKEYLEWSRKINDLIRTEGDGLSQDSILENIDKAIGSGILENYLASHRKEVSDAILGSIE